MLLVNLQDVFMVGRLQMPEQYDELVRLVKRQLTGNARRTALRLLSELAGVVTPETND